MANVSAVLDGINAGRTVLGGHLLYDLPKGVRSRSCECPIAKALRDLDPGVRVNGDRISGLSSYKAFQFAAAIGGEVSSHNGVATIKVPDTWREFVSEFDSGLLPQYDERPPSPPSWRYTGSW